MLKVPPEPRNVWGVCGYMTYRVLYYSNQIIPVSTLGVSRDDYVILSSSCCEPTCRYPVRSRLNPGIISTPTLWSASVYNQYEFLGGVQPHATLYTYAN